MITTPPSKMDFLVELLLLVLISTMPMFGTTIFNPEILLILASLSWYSISYKFIKYLQIKKFGYWVT